MVLVNSFPWSWICKKNFYSKDLFWIVKQSFLRSANVFGGFLFHILLSIPYFETSAVTGADVDLAVTTLLNLVMKRMEQSTYGGQGSEPNGSPVSSHEVEEASVRSRCACWCCNHQLRFSLLHHISLHFEILPFSRDLQQPVKWDIWDPKTKKNISPYCTWKEKSFGKFHLKRYYCYSINSSSSVIYSHTLYCQKQHKRKLQNETTVCPLIKNCSTM